MRCYFRRGLDTCRPREHLGIASTRSRNDGSGRQLRNWRHATVGFIFELRAVPDQTPPGPDRRHRGCQSTGGRRVGDPLRSQRYKFQRKASAGWAAIFQRDGCRMQFGDTLDDRKPKTGASRLPAAGRFRERKVAGYLLQSRAQGIDRFPFPRAPDLTIVRSDRGFSRRTKYRRRSGQPR
jgi:hypothetical protein